MKSLVMELRTNLISYSENFSASLIFRENL